MLVKPFIVAMKLYINNPEKATEEALNQIENEGGLDKHKMFRDPRIIVFYAWLRGNSVIAILLCVDGRIC